MDGPRRFIEADNDSAVDVGDLRRGTQSVKVKKPRFSGGELTRWARSGLSRGLARFLPSNLQRNRSERMGRSEQSRQRTEPGGRS